MEADGETTPARPSRNWWGALWRGLVVDETGKHYQAMGKALWLFCYLVLHADWRRGTLYRKLPTINRDTGIKERTLQQWLILLRRHGYIKTQSTGRGLQIQICKWRSIVRPAKRGKPSL